MKTNTPFLKPDVRKKMSEAKEGRTPWSKGKKGIHSEEALRRISEVNKNRTHSIKERKRRSISIKDKWREPEYRAKQLAWRVGEGNPFYGKKISRENLKKMRLGLKKRPTKPEKTLIGVMKNHGLPFKYVGSGDLMVGNLFPDFIHTGGKKKIIEVFGRAFHDPKMTFKEEIPHHQTYNGRMDYYKQLGYDCLIFWDDELKEENKITYTINDFIGDGK